jgi:predicted LPLAT superfamily acyltransferase
MSEGRRTHWANVSEAGFGLGVWLLYFVDRFLGRWPLRAVLAPVVLYYVLGNRVARQSSREYFARLGLEPSFAHTFRHIASFAESLLDKLLAVSGHYPFEKLRFSGREVMLESLAAGRGGVLVTAHLGCLEVCRIVAGRRKGLRLNVLVHTRNAETYNSVLRRLDPQTQLNLVQVSELGPGMAALLAQRVDAGEFVVITADRVPLSDTSGRTVVAPFLGADAHFPIGPWVLAAALKCQVILFSVVHEADTYHARFERLAERVDLPRAHREAAAAGYVRQYAQRLEALCRGAPYDWFNFFPFWEPPRA